MNLTKNRVVLAAYKNPGRRKGLLDLAKRISKYHLSKNDNLIGFIGKPKSGKSVLIEGMFSEVMLTNDDENINVRPLPLMEDFKSNDFKHQTYHMDALFEAAFSPKYKLARAVVAAFYNDKRIIIEHFDQIYPIMNFNAELLIELGEEIIVTRLMTIHHSDTDT